MDKGIPSRRVFSRKFSEVATTPTPWRDPDGNHRVTPGEGGGRSHPEIPQSDSHRSSRLTDAQITTTETAPSRK